MIHHRNNTLQYESLHHSLYVIFYSSVPEDRAFNPCMTITANDIQYWSMPGDCKILSVSYLGKKGKQTDKRGVTAQDLNNRKTRNIYV